MSYLCSLKTIFLMRKKFFRILWTLYILGILAIGIIFFCIFTGAIGYMPDIQQLQNPVNKFATQVFSADGKQLGTWSYSSANRVFADYDELRDTWSEGRPAWNGCLFHRIRYRIRA